MLDTEAALTATLSAARSAVSHATRLGSTITKLSGDMTIPDGRSAPPTRYVAMADGHATALPRDVAMPDARPAPLTHDLVMSDGHPMAMTCAAAMPARRATASSAHG